MYDRLTTVERDLTAVATGLESIGSTLAKLEHTQLELARIVNNRGRTDWAVVSTLAGGVAALLVFYTSLVTGPIEDEQARMQEDFRYESSLVQRINETEHAEFQRDLDELSKEMRARTQQRFTKNDHRQFADDINQQLRELRESLSERHRP